MPDDLKTYCTAEQWQLLLQYLELVKQWNVKVNLVSRKDIDHVMDHHLMPCLAYKQLGRLHDHESILDIGSGGGFPGIVNAILFPTSTFVLVDSTRKKITALTNMIQQLQLTNVTAVWSRVEDMIGQFDHTTSRAVAPLANLWRWSKPLLKPNGSMEAMKGGDLTEELAQLNRPYMQYENIVSVVND